MLITQYRGSLLAIFWLLNLFSKKLQIFEVDKGNSKKIDRETRGKIESFPNDKF